MPFVWRYVWMTNGGAHIDPEAHVLDPDGNVIEGLFAAGACAHGQKSNMFNPGSGLNMALGYLHRPPCGPQCGLGPVSAPCEIGIAPPCRPAPHTLAGRGLRSQLSPKAREMSSCLE